MIHMSKGVYNYIPQGRNRLKFNFPHRDDQHLRSHNNGKQLLQISNGHILQLFDSVDSITSSPSTILYHLRISRHPVIRHPTSHLLSFVWDQSILSFLFQLCILYRRCFAKISDAIHDSIHHSRLTCITRYAYHGESISVAWGHIRRS
jgi:hypothetical protein